MKRFLPKAYNHFLTKDFLTASHSLVPQIECCLRNLLQQIGVPIYHINDDGTEEWEHNISNLLAKCVEKEIFTEDLAWVLEIYLISKQINLRNKIAHGELGDHKEANAPNVAFLCYLVFYLVFGGTKNPQ